MPSWPETILISGSITYFFGNYKNFKQVKKQTILDTKYSLLWAVELRRVGVKQASWAAFGVWNGRKGKALGVRAA